MNRKGAYPILSKYYEGELVAALKDLYPDHKWLLWQFKRVPANWWKDKEHQRMYFEWIGSLLGVKQLDDWYKVKVHEFNRRDGEGNLSFLQSFYHIPLFKLTSHTMFGSIKVC